MVSGEIIVPYWGAWTGIGTLNGATVGTDHLMVALYDTTGALIANSAVAGVLSAGANAFQEIAFTSATAPLAPGRYFLAVQCNGTTATTRRMAAADGGIAMCSIVAARSNGAIVVHGPHDVHGGGFAHRLPVHVTDDAGGLRLSRNSERT